MAEATKSVGRFEIVERIGRGGMAVVYLARQPGLDRVVALKELRRFDDEADGTLAERFLREARMAGSLSHPNVVTVFDYFEEDGTPYIAMEYMERGSLRPLIGALTLAQVAGVLQGVLAGLGHAEARGIVHRDLKPENLLVGSDGGIKIADLGIAKAFNQVSMGLTKSGMAIGTPTYMAPEQATAKGVGPWTDLYATGVISYELLVGRVPFLQADTPLSILWQHVNDPIPPPRELQPDLDPRIADWLERMLAKSPDERPRSARDAWHELEEIVVDLLGWRWRQSASLVESVADRTREREPAEAEATPEETDGFETFPPRAAAQARPAPPEPVLEPEPATAAPPAEVEQGVTSAPTTGEEPAPGRLAPAEADRSALTTIFEPAAVPAKAETQDSSSEFLRAIDRAPRRRPSARVGIAAAAVALAGGAATVVALAFLGGDPDPPPPKRPPLADPRPSPSERIGLSVSDGKLYVAAPRGRVAVLDGTTLERIAAVTDAGRPRAVGVRGGAVWVADDGTLTRFSPSLRPLAASVFLDGASVSGAPGTPLAASGRTPDGSGRVCLLGSPAPGPCVELAFPPAGLGATSGRIFAADEAGAAVVPLRLRAGELVAETPIVLAGGSRPHGTLTPFGGRLYVSVDRGIAVLDLDDGGVERVIRLRTTPADLWVSPLSGRLFAPLYAQDAVAVLDLTAARPRPRVLPAGREPVAVAGGTASRGTNVVYVANAGDGTIARLNALTGERLGSSKVRALIGRRLDPVVARAPRFARVKRTVTARIALGGGRLEAGGLRIRDQSIADGSATIELWQGGIGEKIDKAAKYGATITASRGPGRVVIRVTSKAGTFDRLRARLAHSGNALVLTLVMPRPKQADTTQDPSRPDSGDPPSPPDPPVPPDPEPPTKGCAAPRPGSNFVCVNGVWVQVG